MCFSKDLLNHCNAIYKFSDIHTFFFTAIFIICNPQRQQMRIATFAALCYNMAV